jgi:anaerobic magnesium-protoporphyrin IX monomethyl ester cyclase
MATERSALLISLINSTDNLGLKYIHSSLQHEGIRSEILFHTADDASYFDAVADFVKESKVNAVGISLMSRFFYAAAGLTDAIRKECGDNIPIVWGGIHPTIDPKGCEGHADYVCVGEGEDAFGEFLRNLEGKTLSQQVSGISATGTGEHSVSPRIENLDDLVFPEFLPHNAWVTDQGRVKPLTPLLLKKHCRHNGTYLSVMTSRGCPFSCSYCCNNLLHTIYGKKIRKRSPESVIEEIDMNLSRSGLSFRYLNVYDDCFTAHSPEWLDTFVKYYKQLGIPLIFRAIPQFITREKIAILKGAPCGFALIGLQTGSERTLNEVYQRKHSQKAFLNCAQLLDENDIPAIYDVIVDNPYETVADTRETVKVISELPSTAYLSLASLTFYKYTALYDKAKTDGFAVDDHLTKNQDAWNKSSKEVKAIKFAVFLGKESALEVLNGARALTRVKFRLLNVLIAKVLEPLRYLKLMYLSHGRRKMDFLGLLLSHARDFGKRYFSLERTNKHAH